jgi:hypothetical protein
MREKGMQFKQCFNAFLEMRAIACNTSPTHSRLVMWFPVAENGRRTSPLLQPARARAGALPLSFSPVEFCDNLVLCCRAAPDMLRERLLETQTRSRLDCLCQWLSMNAIPSFSPSASKPHDKPAKRETNPPLQSLQRSNPPLRMGLQTSAS